MPVYLLKLGTIETNSDGEVVGVSRAYIHLLGRDITNVIKRPEVQGIKKSAEPYPDAGLSAMQTQQREFRRYGKNVLRERKPTGR